MATLKSLTNFLLVGTGLLRRLRIASGGRELGWQKGCAGLGIGCGAIGKGTPELSQFSMRAARHEVLDGNLIQETSDLTEIRLSRAQSEFSRRATTKFYS